ncbi:hypothetical protein BDY21DRAFT_371792 [Lineolata rhizophorae]|uniref:Tubulin-specific chaperone A n=1 Tax=Lineolata rhizophorae TaxID=578093 RepID=A0A6A6P1I8_9PEZI|nr:hypothetical protein BDY21DRAFT_371792 [Lineolata rhizophorae]
MPPPSKLSIATSAVQRLVKEEASYHKEVEQQESRILRLEQSGGDENAEYELKQEVCPAHPFRIEMGLYVNLEMSCTEQRTALEETLKVIPSVKKRLVNAMSNLEDHLTEARDNDSADPEELRKAEEVMRQGKDAVTDIPS